MSILQYKNPISPIQVLNPFSVARNELFGTNFSVLGVGGFMEVYNLDDLQYTVPSGRTGTIEFSGNTIPIQFKKGSGSVFSPDVLTLNSDNISSGRRRLGMLVYVYETDKIYQFTIRNYDSLWSAATGATGAGGKSVVINTFGTVVKNNSVAGQNFINAWTGSTIEGVSGFTNANAAWRVLSFSGGGGSSTADTFVTGFTLSSNTITLTQNRTDQYSAFTISLSAYTGSSSTSGAYLPLSGGTVTGNTIFNSGLTATTISATTYFNLPVTADTFVTGFTFNTSTYDLTIKQNNGKSDLTQSLSILASDLTVTGGTYNSNTGVATFTNNTGGTFQVSGFLTGFTDTLVTAFTYNNNTFTITDSRGSAFTASINTMTGLTATTISATTYENVSSNFQYEIHVSQVDGSDVTGDGTLLNPVATITQALTFLTGSRKTIIVHPGTYSENVTVANGNTTIATSELTGANTLLSGTLTIGSLGSGSRISGLKMSNLVISGTAQAYISNCTVDTQVIKSSSGYVEIINTEMQCTLGIQISGSGTTIINGNKNVGISVSNASAQVIIKGCNSVVTPSASAGNLAIVDCIVTALGGNGITITNSATTLTLLNSQVLVQAGNFVAPISVAGIYSIINTIYDKPNSTFTGNSTNSVDYFQYINADKFITQGGTSLQYVMGDGSLSNGFTGGTVSGVTNFTNGLTANTISATTYQNLPNNVTGLYLPLSGGTVTGGTIFNSGLTATTISATTYQNLPVTADTFVTGFTLSSNTLTISQNRLDQYSAFTISLSAYTGTSISGLYLPLSGGTVTGNTIFQSGLTANTLNVTGDTLLSGLTASTISATTYQNVNAVTGGSYSNGTITLSGTGNFASSISGFPTTFINDYLPLSGGTVTGNTIFNSGLTANTLNVTGNTLLSGLTATSISATTYLNYPDTFVTGFTLSSNTITLTQNRTDGYSSFTISLSAYTGSSSTSGAFLPLSGGTVTGNTFFTSGLSVNYVDFDTTPNVPSPTGGTLYYDSNENALSYKPITPSNDVTVNIGQESLIRIYNDLGVQINNGQALHVTGATSGAPTVSLAIGTGGDSVQFQISGIATHDIPNSTFGFMTVFGIVRDINLTGFSVGEQIYLSQTVAGGLAKYSDLFYTGRTCEVGHILDNSSNGKLSVAILNEIEGTIITTQESNILAADNSSTGVFQFSGLSIDTPSGTTFSVGEVEGWIIDNVTTPANPTIKLIIYSGSSGNSSLYYSSATETYILLTSASTLIQQTSFPTPQQRRQNLYLGKFGHGNRQFLINAFNEPDSSLSPVSQLRDMFTVIKLINDGVIASANGPNLNINTSAGVLYGLGIGYITNKLNPNSLTINSQSPATFQYRTQTGGTATNRTTIDPLNYDLNGVITPITGTKATNQRIYLLQNGQIRIQYGQQEYNQLAAAVAALQNETFTTFSNFRDNGILIGILSVLSTCTQLNDTTKAQFFSVSKFGELIGAAGGTSTTTLQQAYNNSATPEIVTNSVEGALTIQNGTGNADNVTNLLEGKNTATSTTSFIRADGLISGSSVSAPTISATTYYGVNAVTGGTYNGTTGVITLSGTGNVNGNQITGFGTGGGGMTWNSANTTQSMTADNGYVTTAATLTTFTLPSTIAFGKTVEIAGNSSGLWQLNQNSGQQIRFGNQTTATTSGILSATSQGDCVKLICVVADTSFIVTSSVGNIFFN